MALLEGASLLSHVSHRLGDGACRDGCTGHRRSASGPRCSAKWRTSPRLTDAVTHP
jgi:hypothetical protein